MSAQSERDQSNWPTEASLDEVDVVGTDRDDMRTYLRHAMAADPIVKAAVEEARSLLGQFGRDELTDSQRSMSDLSRRRHAHELRDIRKAANNIAIDYGKLRLEYERLKYENGQIRDRMQSKIYRQAKAIVRLEAKIRELGGKPHDDVPTAADAVGGAETETEPMDATGKRAGWLR